MNTNRQKKNTTLKRYISQNREVPLLLHISDPLNARNPLTVKEPSITQSPTIDFLIDFNPFFQVITL